MSPSIRRVAIGLASVLTVTALPIATFASSHREAPLISQDPAVDQTDLYAFVSPDKEDTVTLVGNYYPGQAPNAGPNYFRFADNAAYAFHIDNNGDAKPDVSYVFKFRTTTKNGGTFLFNTGVVDSLLSDGVNVSQEWTLFKVPGGFTGKTADLNVSTQVAKGPVAPPVIGDKSQPNYEKLAMDSISTKGGMKVFAGARDDSFFVDLKVFDLLNLGSGKDSLAGLNVNSIVFQLPIKDIATSKDPVVGVWGATYRPAVTIRTADGKEQARRNWIQVSRLGMPLVNEVVVPLAYKDYFNASLPEKDADTKPYADVVLKPELAGLFKGVLGLNVPLDNRTDLVTVFLTGVPGLNQPMNVRAAEMLRLNTSIMPVAEENTLGVFGGDTAGFPNGRRLADDVTDIAIQAVAGKLVDGYEVDSALGDGVNANDMAFSGTFPYLASPHGATNGTARMEMGQ